MADLINVGTFPNDATGDPARLAFQKINGVLNGTTPIPGPIVLGPPVPPGIALTINNAVGFFGVNITGANPSALYGVEVTNTQAGVASETLGLVVNNDNIRAFIMGKTSSVFAGSRFPGSPVGELSYLQSGGNVPISFVVGSGAGHEALGIGATGGVSVAAPIGGGNALTSNGVVLVDGSALPDGSGSAMRIIASQVAGASVNGLLITGPASSNTGATALVVGATTAAGKSNGVTISAGTNASDFALRVSNAAFTTTFMSIDGTGAVTMPGGINNILTIGGVPVTGNLTGLSINNTSTVDGDVARMTINSGSSTCALWVAGPNQTTPIITSGPSGSQFVIRTLGSNTTPIVFGVSNVYRGQFVAAATGGFVVAQGFACNGVTTPYTGSAGWGTPTGTGVIANFPGASAILTQCSQAIATIIAVLKNTGFMLA